MERVVFNVYPPERKIQRIKALRDAAYDSVDNLSWLGLAEAKDVVDTWMVGTGGPERAARLLLSMWREHGKYRLEFHRSRYAEQSGRLLEWNLSRALALYHGPVALKGGDREF
jgi:hypothetical protein